MSESKKAKYFCENCGAEVNANARFCPNCGKFFAAVRCPRCTYTGMIRDFKSGCPRCHYAMSKEELYGTETEENSIDGRKHKLSRKSKSLIKKSFSIYRNKNKKNIASDSPTWVLIISILVIIFLVVFILLKCNEEF